MTSLRILFASCLLALASFFSGSQPAQAQTYNLLYTFAGPPADGDGPLAPLVQDAEGNFYGATGLGGAHGGNLGFGTLFKVDSAGVESVLYSFTNGADGSIPEGSLYRDADGNLYGTNENGGDSKCQCGTVLKLDTNNVLTTLHRFKGGSDGAFPTAGLVFVKGNFYGTTNNGGGTGCSNFGCGTIFKMTPTGTLTVLYRFTGAADGSLPVDVIRDPTGNLYGVTGTGGTANKGTVFELDAAANFSVLYTFTGGSDGGNPQGRLIRDANGILHGYTATGGDPTCQCGVVFRLDTAGHETVLHKFFGGGGGTQPDGLLDLGGSIYGVTYLGGDLSCGAGGGCGVLFVIGNTGHYSVLHTFTGGDTDGAGPSGNPILGSDGAIYAPTALGGSAACFSGGCGVIFKYTP